MGAARDGIVVGYILAAAKSDATWGPNIWVEAAGHAAAEPEVVRELYAVAAADVGRRRDGQPPRPRAGHR